jgi:D-3-phosphoglycerate dehydrogenase
VFDPTETLVLDLLQWIGRRRRRYVDVMEIWRTSCPRLPVWEEANDRGFVERHSQGTETFITVTDLGWAFLRRHRQVSDPASSNVVPE